MLVFQISRYQGQYRFALKAKLGLEVLRGERQKDREGARRGMEAVRESAPLDSRYERVEAAGQFYFHLLDAEGQRLGRSSAFASADLMEKAIAQVKKEAPKAPLTEA